MEGIKRQEYLRELEENNILLSEAGFRITKGIRELANPAGERNWTDQEIDSGKRLIDIIEEEIKQAIKDVTTLGEKREEIKSFLSV